MHSIGINFCGGCNPRIERLEIAHKTRDILSAGGYEVTYNHAAAEFVVYLSGCTASCAWRYRSGEGPSAVVAGNSLDASTVEESELAIRIAAKAADHFSRTSQ